MQVLTERWQMMRISGWLVDHTQTKWPRWLIVRLSCCRHLHDAHVQLAARWAASLLYLWQVQLSERSQRIIQPSTALRSQWTKLQIAFKRNDKNMKSFQREIVQLADSWSLILTTFSCRSSALCKISNLHVRRRNNHLIRSIAYSHEGSFRQTLKER